MCLQCRRHLIQTNVNLHLQSKVKGEEWKVERVPGLSLSQDWTTTTVWQDAIMSCFPFSIFFSHIPKFLFGSEQINKTLKSTFEESWSGMWNCLLCPTLLHQVSQRKGDNVNHIQKLHSEQISQHFPGGEKKKYIPVPGVLHYAWQKLKMRLKKPYSIRKQGKSWENKCSPRKIDVRKRMVGLILYFPEQNKITKCNSVVKHPYVVYIQERTSFVSRMQFDMELCIRNKLINTS